MVYLVPTINHNFNLAMLRIAKLVSDGMHWKLSTKHECFKKENNNNWPVREIRVNRFWQIPSPTRSRCRPPAMAWLWRSCWSVRAGKQNKTSFLIRFNPSFKKVIIRNLNTKPLFNQSLKTKQKSQNFKSTVTIRHCYCHIICSYCCNNMSLFLPLNVIIMSLLLPFCVILCHCQ